MTRAVIRLVLCGALVCLTAAVSLGADVNDVGDQEVPGHLGGWQQARGELARRHEGNDRARRLPVQRRREDAVGAGTEAWHGGHRDHHHEDDRDPRHRDRGEERDRDAEPWPAASSFAPPTTNIKMFSQSDIDKRGIKIMREGKPAEITDFRRQRSAVGHHRHDEAATGHDGAGSAGDACQERCRWCRHARGRWTSPLPGRSRGGGSAAPARVQSGAATSGAAPRTLPKTASPLPILGLTGLASLLAGLGLTVGRRRATLADSLMPSGRAHPGCARPRGVQVRGARLRPPPRGTEPVKGRRTGTLETCP